MDSPGMMPVLSPLMAETWKNRSPVPVSGAMNPKPRSPLNLMIVPARINTA